MSLNILPFQIIFDGKLPDKNPFNQNKECAEMPNRVNEKMLNSVSSTTFRGRRLHGNIIKTQQSNHSIAILSENGPKEETSVTIENYLSDITYWNYDDEVKESDDIPQLLNAVYFSNILHRET
ncbi:hypothetical protein OIY81_146 [Cryptosporidium canis]|nr:hypothetical protein OIY81_146 [Cryptosporidium canis]